MNDQDDKQIVNDRLFLHIKSADKTFFEGDANSVSSTNQKGAFDIYPDHENFISVVSQKLIINHIGGRDEELVIESGIIKVLDNKVYIFVGV